MRRRGRTLAGMDHDRLLSDTLDVIIEQGGDWDAVEHVLRGRYDDEDELSMALDTYAAAYLLVYRWAPDGPGFLRRWLEHRRRLVPPEPGPRWGWRATG